MQVTETRVGYVPGEANSRHIARLKLFTLENLLALATPEELPVVGAPHTVSKYGISVVGGTPLVEVVFAVGGCKMQERSFLSAEGEAYDLELTVNVPRNGTGLLSWVERNKGKKWVALWQDLNGLCYIAGEPELGLSLEKSRVLGEVNQTTLTLRSRSWHSVYFLETYETNALFADVDFDLSFDFSFNA